MISKAIIFDHRGRTKLGHEGPVEIRVTVNRKPYYINSGIKVRGSELLDGQIIDRADADVLNQRLDIVTNRVLAAINDCIENDRPIDVAEIRRQVYSIQDEKADDTTMYDWIVEQVPLLPIKDSTRKRYYVLISRLKEYGQLMSWSDFTAENVYKFDSWLHTLPAQLSNADKLNGVENASVTDATVYNYHRTLGALATRAVMFGVIDSNPYEKMRGEFRKGIHENVEYLTEDEIAAIESLHPIPGTQMAMARDLFVFQMYTGLSYSDAQAFDINDYKQVNGKWVSVGERIKTGVPYVSQLLPQAVEILERYNMKVPKVNNSQYNLSLKTIQQALGLKTRLHSHLARHTFATRALALGVPIESVSRMLGHTNIVQTQRYAKVLAESVRKGFDLLAEKTKK